MEYEVEAEMIHEFVRNAATGHAFSPIVASGKDTLRITLYQKQQNVSRR